MTTEQDAEKKAREWVKAWNSHDLNAIMAHYADDVELTSPFVVNALSIDSGTIKGKEKLRAYFKRGLATYPELKFELSQVLAGVNSLIVYYRGIRGMMAAEMMVMNPQGRILRVMAHYNTGSQ
jgi:hypothetical protein